MTDHKSQADSNETPEDVATLYSWANLHGAKYRDFSGPRAVAREESRLRVEAAQAAERKRLEEEAERKRQEEVQLAARIAAEAAEAARQAEAERLAEIARQAEAERQAVLAAQEAQRQAALQRSWQPPTNEAYQGEYGASFDIDPVAYPEAAYSQFEPQFRQQESLAAALPLVEASAPRPLSFRPEESYRSGPLPGLTNSQSGSVNFDEAASRFSGQPDVQAPIQGAKRASAQAAPSQFASAQITERLNETPVTSSYAPGSFGSSSQWATSQPAQPPTSSGSSAQNSGQPQRFYPAGPVQEPVQQFVRPSVLPTPRQSYANSSNSSGYGASSDSPYSGGDYTEGSYGGHAQESVHENQEQPATFRPAWLAPDPIGPVAPQQQAPSVPQSLTPPMYQQVVQPAPSAQQPRHSSGFAQAPAQKSPQGYNGGYASEASAVPQDPYARPMQAPSTQPLAAPQHPSYAMPSGFRVNEGQGLMPRPSELAQPAAPAQNMADGSNLDPRDRGPNRWYALKSVFDPQATAAPPVPQAPPQRAPVLAVFSLAGGVGKTSLIASLGRALSTCGERVLLIDTSAFGLLPFFFGARDQRPGQLRTFNPPGVSLDAPIQLVTLDPEGQAPDPQSASSQQEASQPPNQDWLAREVDRYARGVNRVLIDLPTASGSTTRRVLRLSPVVLVPIVPDMNSVVSVGAIESFFHHSGKVNGSQIMPHYVLNRFDYSLPLHLDVREILREQIGDRLLPFALRRSPAVSEALAEGMTVIDYAPTGVVAEDYASLAGWVRSLSAPASQVNRGVRWSER